MKYSKRRLENKQIAKERVEILKKMKKKYPAFSKRYDELIKRIAKKYRLEKDF